MNKKIFELPWPHMVINDFFDTDTMQYINIAVEGDAFDFGELTGGQVTPCGFSGY